MNGEDGAHGGLGRRVTRSARKNCRFSLFNSGSHAPRSGGNEWAVNRCGREKRWRATAFQDAGAFTGYLAGAERLGMCLLSGILRSSMVAGGSEKGNAELRRWARGGYCLSKKSNGLAVYI